MKYKNIILFGVLAFAFASCSDDENPEAPQPVSFISEAKAYSTRTNQNGDQWLTGNKLGAYMLETGTHTPVGQSSNVLYTAEADGSPVAFSSASPFTYPADKSKVDFIAYYPYAAEVRDFVYPVSLGNQSAGSTAHDLMRAVSRSGYSVISSKEVSMSFSHQLSKVIFKFADTKGNAIYPEQMRIKGMNTTAGFNLATATLQNVAAVADITPYKTTGGTFEAIVMPAGMSASFAIEYTLNEKSYSWNLADATPALNVIGSGYKYTFSIVQADEPRGTVEVEGGSVTPWENETLDGATADLVVNYTTFPANNATGVYKDTYLKLTFTGEAPAPGTTGSIKVYKASDNTLADEINMADVQNRLPDGGALNSKMDIIGAGNSSGRYRVVNYNPVTIDGNTATIKLHSNRLEYDTKYYVLIDNKAIKHADFLGIKDASRWTFTTKAAPAVPTDAAHTVTVGGDGSNADFRTVQAAIDFLVLNVAKDTQKTVYVHNGVYEELLFLRGVNNFTIKGESREGVVIRYNNYDGLNGGTGGSVSISPNAAAGTTITKAGGRSVLLVETVDKLRIESLTLENTHVKNGSGDQAEVIYANNDNNATAFVNCNLLSCQDTLNLKGFCWFYNCLVAGDVDFIWGSPGAALFENSEIRSVDNGYVLQARVASGNKGFVFLNCRLTTTGKATYMYLCRTAGSSSYYDNIAFVNCKMAEIYTTYGWGLSGGANGTPPNPSVATLENGYKQYGCTNPEGGSITINNSQYAYTLSEAEYQAHYSNRNAILSGYANGTEWFVEN